MKDDQRLNLQDLLSQDDKQLDKQLEDCDLQELDKILSVFQKCKDSTNDD